MKNDLVFEGKNYISSKRAANITSYAQDYIGQLCRAGKLEGKMIGRSWFVSEESLLGHQKSAAGAASDIQQPAPEIVTAANEPKAPDEIIASVSEPEIKYEIDKTPLLPELDKKIYSDDTSSISADSQALALKSGPNTDERKATAVFFAALILIVGGFIFNLSSSPGSNFLAMRSQNSSENISASVLSAVSDFFQSITNALSRGSNRLASFFTGYSRNTVYPNQGVSFGDTGAPVMPDESSGIVVFPSAGSVAADADEKTRIMNYFSDEVTVQPDSGGQSGIITPVFRQAIGDDFIYVLVPIDDNRK
jgi:hypothetical protein